MKKLRRLCLVFLFFNIITVSLFSIDKDFAIEYGLYIEPFFKPGVTITPEFILSTDVNSRYILFIPQIHYFYFPGTSQSISLLPGAEYTLQIGRSFYLGFLVSSGVSFKNYTAEIYDRYGSLSSKTWEIQSITIAGFALGKSYKNFDIEFNIGWKGLYPYNLGFQHQPYLQIGYRSYAK